MPGERPDFIHKQPRQPENPQPLQGRAEGRESLQGPTTVDGHEPDAPAYGGRESTIVQPHEQIGAPGDREGKKVYTLKIPSEEQLAKVNPEVLKFAGFFLLREWGNELTPDGFVI